jgi:hypothetical protein
MPENQKSAEEPHRKPRNKSNMDQPQEEFIAPESGHTDKESEHGLTKETPPTGPAAD